MKKFPVFILLFFAFFSSVFALEIPQQPSGRVSDYANLLTSSERQELEQKLEGFEQSTSNQVAVATFLSLEGESIEDFSIRLGEKWKIGHKGRDNGVLLLIFKNDRQLRIEVGYGLEGALPDATSKLIIENEIVPLFKNGNFKGGIFAGVEAIFKATKGEYQPLQKKSGGGGSSSYKTPLILFGIFLLFSLLNRKRGGGSGGGRTYSGGWGSGGGSSSWGSSGGSSSWSGGGGSFGGGGSSGRW